MATTFFTGSRVASQTAAGDSPLSQRVKFFEHAGKEILLVDFSHSNDVAGVKTVADECRRVIISRPFASVRTLVTVEGTWFDKETIQVSSDLAAHNRPYVVRSAVIGVTGLRQIAFNAIVALTRRNMRMFDSRDEALAWLVAE
jgi:hypothetical protein